MCIIIDLVVEGGIGKGMYAVTFVRAPTQFRQCGSHTLVYGDSTLSLKYMVKTSSFQAELISPLQQDVPLYVFFWVFPRRPIVVCRRFGTLCKFHLQGLDVEYEV